MCTGGCADCRGVQIHELDRKVSEGCAWEMPRQMELTKQCAWDVHFMAAAIIRLDDNREGAESICRVSSEGDAAMT
jgi:hypothetical protein